MKIEVDGEKIRFVWKISQKVISFIKEGEGTVINFPHEWLKTIQYYKKASP